MERILSCGLLGWVDKVRIAYEKSGRNKMETHRTRSNNRLVSLELFLLALLDLFSSPFEPSFPTV